MSSKTIIALMILAILTVSTFARPMEQESMDFEDVAEAEENPNITTVEKEKHEEYRRIVFFLLSTSVMFFIWAIGIFITLRIASKINNIDFENLPKRMKTPRLFPIRKDHVLVPTDV